MHSTLKSLLKQSVDQKYVKGQIHSDWHKSVIGWLHSFHLLWKMQTNKYVASKDVAQRSKFCFRLKNLLQREHGTADLTGRAAHSPKHVFSEAEYVVGFSAVFILVFICIHWVT